MTTSQPRSRRQRQPLILIETRRRPMEQERLPDAVVEVLLEQAEARGWRLLDLNKTGGSLSGENDPAGALVTLLPDDPNLQPIIKLGCPIVRLGRLPHPDDAQVPAVIPDHALAARWAASYFPQRGFTQLALLGHEQMLAMPLLMQTMEEEAGLLGFKYEVHQFKTQTDSVVSPDMRASRYDRRAGELTAWLAALPKPIGLITATSSLAVMASVACRRSGLAVPEQVAILSLGEDRQDCAMCPVPISAIDLNPADVARTAIDLLDASMQGEEPPPSTFVPPRGIVARRSTDILAVNDPTVARAIRYMWDHLDQQLSVDDVAKAMKTPRYKLERLFKKHLKRGVYAELRRARLQHFAQFLRTTDQTVDELAPQIGYLSAKRLHRVFRETYGTTPRRYRLDHRKQHADSNIAVEL